MHPMQFIMCQYIHHWCTVLDYAVQYSTDTFEHSAIRVIYCMLIDPY